MSVRLVALTDSERFPDPAPALARLCELGRPGSVGIVLRDRDAGYQERLVLGRRLREITRDSGRVFLVADRVDLALELGADGVHLPTDGLLPSEVGRLFPGAAISRAHHRAEALPDSEWALLDLLLVSPAFAERKGRSALGDEGLAARLTVLRGKGTKAHLLALGGVDSANALRAIEARADGVAAIAAAHDSRQQIALVTALGIQRG